MSKVIEIINNNLLGLLKNILEVLPGLFTGLIIIMLSRYIADFNRKYVTKIVEKSINSKSLQLLVCKLTHISTWIFGIAIACVVAFPGLDLAHLVTTLGVSSVAIGFAFQDICKNFLAGIILLLQEPFKIGDEIIVDSYEGTVEHINTIDTVIRTYTGERILISNATIFTNAVRIKTAFENRRTDLAIGVDYNTNLPEAKDILYQTIKTIEGVWANPEPEIDLVNFGDSSIDLIVRYWTKPQEKTVRRIKTQAIMVIKDAFDQVNISINYPIRTVYYYDQEKFNDWKPRKID